MVGIVAILASVTVLSASADNNGDDDDDRGRRGRDNLTEVVYVCVNIRSGIMRAVDGDTECRNRELMVSWNASGGVGPVGPEGPQGPPGPVGPEGPQGPQGEQGLPGEVGPAGADGAIGPAGADGAIGPQGPAGADGAIGPQGPAGADGAIGPQGPAGADGAQGPQGIQGIQGPAGLAGADGTDGLDGSDGIDGIDGFSCWDTNQNYLNDLAEDVNGDSFWNVLDCQGAQGVQGPQGPQGIQGIQGPAGADGQDGADGLDGAAGADGADGTDGYNCWDTNQNHVNDFAEDVNSDNFWNVLDCQGATGATGAQGPQGPQGDPGVSNLINFSCPTGEVVIGFDSLGDPVCVSFAYLIDNPPVIDAIGDRTILQTDTEIVSVSGSDSDGDDITFSLDTSHTFISILDGGAGNTATVTISPDHGTSPGTYLVTVRASSNVRSETESFSVEVVADAPPVVSPVTISIVEPDGASVPVTGSDPNGHSVALSLESAPGWLSLTGGNTLVIADSTGLSGGSPYSATLRATANGLITDAAVTINVSPPADTAPVVNAISDQSVDETDTLSLPISATDAEGDSIVLSLVSSHPFVNITDNGTGDGTGTLDITPLHGDNGSYTVTVRATANGLTGDGSFTLNIPEDLPPDLQTLFNQTLTEGDSISEVLSATDIDTEIISLSLESGPVWLSVVETSSASNVVTGSLTGTIPTGAATLSPYTVTVRATANGLVDDETFTLNITPVAVDDPPVLDPIGDQLVLEGQLTSVSLSASDPEGDTMVVSLLSGEAWMSVADGGTGDGSGTLELTPPFGTSGSFSATVQVTANGQTDSETINVTVTDVAVFDDFNSSPLTLPEHLPVVNVNGTPWVERVGNWGISGGQLTELDRFQGGGDKRLTIDAGLSSLDLTSNITFNEGVVGLVLRYESETSWLMVWYDDFQGRLKMAHYNGSFLTFYVDEAFAWTPGTEMEWEVKQVAEGTVQLYVDGAAIPVIDTVVPVLSSSTQYGLFDFAGAFGNGSTGNFFDDFTLK